MDIQSISYIDGWLEDKNNNKLNLKSDYSLYSLFCNTNPSVNSFLLRRMTNLYDVWVTTATLQLSNSYCDSYYSYHSYHMYYDS